MSTYPEDFYQTALRALDDWHEAHKPHDIELLIGAARELERVRQAGEWMAQLLRQALGDMAPADRAAAHNALDQWRTVTR